MTFFRYTDRRWRFDFRGFALYVYGRGWRWRCLLPGRRTGRNSGLHYQIGPFEVFTYRRGCS